jgi:sugar phosphate isomerase/epimerase
MARTAVQLYSLREVDRPLPELLELVADAGFDGVEFAYRVYDADPDAVRTTLGETGLATAGAHVRVERFEDDFDATVGLFESFGAKALTVPGIADEYFQTAAGVEEAVERLDPIGADLAARDLPFCYHNHAGEFDDVEGRTGLEAFFAAAGHVRPQVDLGTALIAGVDPAALIRRLGDVPQLHAKDVDPDAGSSVPLGEGAVDVEACVEAFHDVGGEWLIYEYESEEPAPETTLADAAALLNGLA